jgi:hypothetical protein
MEKGNYHHVLQAAAAHKKNATPPPAEPEPKPKPEAEDKTNEQS